MSDVILKSDGTYCRHFYFDLHLTNYRYGDIITAVI